MSTDDSTPVELYGPDDGGWYTTRVHDWIALCSELKDADVRGYLVLRSLIIEKYKNPVRRLSLADLCALIPGPTTGKPDSSLTRVRGILNALSAVGLVSTPEGGPVKTSSRAAAAIRPIRIRVNDMPADGYLGWRNAEVKLAAIQAGRISDPAQDAGGVEGGAGRISDPPGRKSDPGGWISDPDSAPDVQERELPLVPTLGSPQVGKAPSARSAADGRRPSAGSSAREGEGGSAASSKNQPSPPPQRAPEPSGVPKTKRPGHTREQLRQAGEVCELFPAVLGVRLVPTLTDAILEALAGDVPGADRTVVQLGARIERRWNLHGYAEKFHAGTLESPVGAAIAMVRPLKAGDRYGCADPRCEDGADVDTGVECRACAERRADRAAERRSTESAELRGDVPRPRERPAAWWECGACSVPGKGRAPAGGLCRECRAPALGAAVIDGHAAATVPF